MAKVLITGSTAFVGSHLVDKMVDLEAEVHGLRRPRSPEFFVNPGATYHVGDITDQSAVYYLITKIKPDFIFHLAAQSFVPLSWEAPSLTLSSNLIGSLNILEGVRLAHPEAKVLMAGTSEEYGKVYPQECPITENQPLRPLSPYGASKIGMDMMCQVYAQSYDMQVVVTRAFNHTGPRRGAEFVTSKIAKKLAEIGLGECDPVIELGNLDAVRDFTDVRDVIDAYMAIVDQGKPGEVYNIGSGVGYSVKNVLDILLEISGLHDVEIRQNPQFMRPSDVPILICDATKLKEKIGWQPTYKFEQTLRDLFNYWVARLS